MTKTVNIRPLNAAEPDRNEVGDKHAARRLEILHCAAEIFYKKGFHGASMRDIAEALGVQQASLYYYFQSKSAMLEEICRIGVTEFVDNLLAIKVQDCSVREKITRAINKHLEPVLTHRFYVQAFIYMRRDLPSNRRKPLDKVARQYEEIWHDILREGVESGELRPDLDIRGTVLGILGMCNSAARWSRHEKGFDLSRLTNAFADMVCRGICLRDTE